MINLLSRVLALQVYRRLGSVQISTEIHGTFIGPSVCRYRTVADSMLCIVFLVAVLLVGEEVSISNVAELPQTTSQPLPH